MIAANDCPVEGLEELTADQLRYLIARAAGLLAHHHGELTPNTLRRIATALEDLGLKDRAI